MALALAINVWIMRKINSICKEFGRDESTISYAVIRCKISSTESFFLTSYHFKIFVNGPNRLIIIMKYFVSL